MKQLGIFICAGLVAVAISLPIAVHCYTSSSRSVSVRGLCEEEVRADRVIWPIVFTEGGNSLSGLAKVMEGNVQTIVGWLKAAGIEESDITVASPSVEDHTQWTGYNFSYTMKSVVTVCTSDIDKVLALQRDQYELINKGIAIASNTWERPIHYEYTKLNEIKPAMIEKATVNAHEAADKFAKDSGSHVGKIIKATQGQFSINDRDENTPYIKTVRVVTYVDYQLK